MADNKFVCPKCGKRAWKKTNRKNKLKCTAPYCAYVSPEMTDAEMDEVLNYVPIPPTPLELCMEEIRQSSLWVEEWDYCIDLDTLEEILKKYLINDRAIKALEEVQQYRKHGVTLESALNNMCDLAAAENLIEEYRAIGTPEECRAAMEKQPVFNMDKVVEQLEKKIQTHKHVIEYEKKNGTITEEFQQRKAVEVLEGAIDIVKAGGVDGN